MLLENSLTRNIKKLMDFLKPENNVTTAVNSDKFLVFDTTDSTFKSIQISDLINALGLVNTTVLTSNGGVAINYNNLTNLPNFKIMLLYESPNFSYSGFNVTHTTKTLYADGKIQTIIGSTIDLSTQISNPANKTIYCYIVYDLSLQRYVFKFYDARQNVSDNFVEVAILTTNSTTVTQTIYKENFYWINGYSISSTSTAFCLPVTNNNGKLDSSFIPANGLIYRYSETTTINANSNKQYNLATLFPNTTSTLWSQARVQVYQKDTTSGSPTNGLFVTPDDTSAISQSTDYQTITVYNLTNTNQEYLVNIIM